MAKIRICSTIVHPKPFIIASSKGSDVYSVTPSTLLSDGFCTCPGYKYRGKCSHLEKVDFSMRCRWMAQGDDEQQLQTCPFCGEKAIEYETDPEVL